MPAFNYRSLSWRTARAERLRADRFTCQGCGRDCSREPGRILVHHTIGAKRYPEHALDQRFLESLCSACHDSVEHCIRYRRLAELVAIGSDPQKAFMLRKNWGAVPWQFDLDLEAANDENFTLDPPIEVPEDCGA